MDLFSTLGDSVASIGLALTSAFDSVSNIFYNTTTDTVTLVGLLLIASLAVGLIKLALNLVVRLFTRVK